MDDANTNQIYDYKDISWVENISKKLQDPLLMVNVKDGKKKNDGASSSKIQVPKTPKKRDRKVTPAISRPTLPEKISARSFSISDEEVIEEDNVNQSETTNQFVEPSFPIDMEFVNNVLVENPDVEAEEEIQIQQYEVLEDDDTLKDKKGNNDIMEPPSTVEVPLAGTISAKISFVDTSKDPQDGEE
ncbi:uncharacterized protein LOC114078341 [Solanum pennellii]|uniref:Uncharacterized protein LOC114078341 n=1 Tax=Solanum pennellii TaxID=28526 RepID=A0ABM1VGA5_SOLPN|nr:uncharacterized protein LOC114078341 [Solanum pennellii]